MEVKRIELRGLGGKVAAYLSDLEEGWQSPYGESFDDEHLMHLDTILKEGGCEYLAFERNVYRGVRVIVTL